MRSSVTIAAGALIIVCSESWGRVGAVVLGFGLCAAFIGWAASQA